MPHVHASRNLPLPRLRAPAPLQGELLGALLGVAACAPPDAISSVPNAVATPPDAVATVQTAVATPPAAAPTAEATGPLLYASDSAGAPSDAGTARRRYVVAAIGDSLTDPRSHGGGYLELLADRCPASRFDNYGVGGQMVNQMRRRFARDVLGEPPDPEQPKPRYGHLLVLGGINDICSDETALRTTAKIRADLEWMYRTAKARGMVVVALTMPPWGGFERYYNARRESATLALNQWIREQVRAGTVDAVVDLFPLLSCGRPMHLCDRYGWPDRVHWSAEGHRTVGEALHRSLFADCE